MPILRRNDGTSFVIQPYRESLSLTSTGLLKKELYLLGQNYGGYSRIFRQPDGRFEAVFSRDPGYLLGETVWQHFGKPYDLLYCEALDGESQQALVVVVRGGSVYLDAKIPYANLAEELAPLQAGTGTFVVYAQGDVPLSKNVEPGKFSLDPARVKSFTRLTKGILQELPIRPELNLLPLERAIAELKLNQRAQILTGIGIGLIVLIGLWLWWPAAPEPMEEAQNPLQQYIMALRTPDPGQQLAELSKQIMFAYNVPGWIPTKVDYSNGDGKFELHSLGSPLTGLLDWAATQKLSVIVDAKGAILSLPSVAPPRADRDSIANSQRALALLIDRMMQVVPTNSVQIANTVFHTSYGETGITLSLANISPEVLVLIGRTLTDLPVTLSGCSFNLKNGLLSGTIQLTLLGN